MKQNLIVALAVIVALVIADMLGAITLPTGVVGHEGSTLLVTLNGMRLLARAPRALGRNGDASASALDAPQVR